MNNQNPNVVDATGKRQIASHYYPMIGPYDSTDPNVLEYHMLLMKYSGVDGVMIDWYGQQGSNGDVGSLLTASNAIVNKTGQFGLGFGVVAEDNFWTSASIALQISTRPRPIWTICSDNYFNQSELHHVWCEQQPALDELRPAKVSTAVAMEPDFCRDRNRSDIPDAAVSIGRGWRKRRRRIRLALSRRQTRPTTSRCCDRSTVHKRQLANSGRSLPASPIPASTTSTLRAAGGSTLFYIPENGGQTLTDTLNLTVQNSTSANLDMLQLATFNDFGEGTQFEPTVEDGFRSLNQIQQFTGVSYGTAELQFIYELYLARKKYAGKTAIETQLDQVRTISMR